MGAAARAAQRMVLRTRDGTAHPLPITYAAPFARHIGLCHDELAGRHPVAVLTNNGKPSLLPPNRDINTFLH